MPCQRVLFYSWMGSSKPNNSVICRLYPHDGDEYAEVLRCMERCILLRWLLIIPAMIIPKRRIVFYFVVITSSVWIYLATYHIFSNELSAGADTSNDDDGIMYSLLMYDRTPDRNPDKPGEWGAAVSLNFLEKKREEKGFSDHAFNRVASDKISLERNLPDVRNYK